MRKQQIGILVFLLLLLVSETAWAREAKDLFEEMDFSEISNFLKDTKEVPLTFEEILESLQKGGEIPYEKIGDYIKSLILSGFAENKELALKLFAISLAFSILKNYAKNFSNSYLAEICFFLCYGFMMALLLQSFFAMNETVAKATGNMADFMKAWIPAYCTAVSFTLNFHSSAAAYSLIFTAIYLAECLIGRFLVPLVQVYVMMEFLNHLVEEERFHRLSELIADTVCILLKGASAFILGINIIQGMVAPAMDRLAGNSIARTIQMVPGIGNVVNGVGQIFISSSLVIKNCIGAAALVVLVLLCAAPFLKMALLAALYKLLAAVLEPISDKRLSGGMNGIANGGMLYLKILNTCFTLFFLTIALSSAASGLGAFG